MNSCRECVRAQHLIITVSPGQQDQPALSWAEGRPCPFNGGFHGDRLHIVLDAIWRCGNARLIWAAGRGVACRHFNTIPAGKDQHRYQPGYICAAQQPGNNTFLLTSLTLSSHKHNYERLVLYLSISIVFYFVLLSHYNSEVNRVPFTPLHNLISLVTLQLSIPHVKI